MPVFLDALRVCLVAATTTAALPAGAAPVAAHSEVAGFVMTPLAKLPHAPVSAALDDICKRYRVAPKTDAGRQAKAAGWIVTSEARLGRTQAVSFAGSFEPATSGVCTAHDANIAIFDGSSLVALAYAARGAKVTLGALAPLDKSLPESGLLVGNGEGPLAPVAELHESDGALLLTAVAPLRKVCGGKAEVPNVYNLAIGAARKRLIAKSWRPERPKEPLDEGDQASHLAAKGIVEAQTCSGTGYGFCTFNYRGDAGTLSVMTVGDDAETVVDVAVTCR